MKRKWNAGGALLSNKSRGRRMPSAAEGQDAPEIQMIEIASIDVGNNPRTNPKRDPRAFKMLVGTIKKVGLLEPIVVRKKGERFQLIAGERRMLACKSLKWKTIPAVVKSVDDLAPELVPLARVIENHAREDLLDAEEALHIYDFKEGAGMTNREIAEVMGESEQWVKNKIQHAQTLMALMNGKKSTTSYLVELPTSIMLEVRSVDAADKARVLKAAHQGDWTVKELRTHVADLKSGAGKGRAISAPSKKAGGKEPLTRHVDAILSLAEKGDAATRRKVVKQVEGLLAKIKKGK